MYGDRKCQDEWELLAVDVQFFEHHEPAFHPLNCIGLGPSIKLDSDVVCYYCNHCTDCSVYQPTASADVPAEHNTCADCNLQHSFEASCQVTVCVNFFHCLCGLFGPLECALSFVHLINARNLYCFCVQPGQHVRVELLAGFPCGKQTQRSLVCRQQLLKCVYS